MVEVRRLEPDDWAVVEAIWSAGIDTRNATFETETPTWATFDATRHRDHRLVAVDTGDHPGTILGWAALMPVSRRPCYAGVAENSVYVAPVARGRGVGRALMEALVQGADRGGLWTIQTSIFPENHASLALHERVGFRVVGRRERIAQLDGVWRDTLFLERRSPIVT
jgi:L-amino acid N-acyltransferase YncA